MGFSLKIEYVALILNCVLLFFYCERDMQLNFKKKCFIFCMGLSILSILVNIASVVFLGRLSDGWMIFLNSAYFICIMLNVSVIAFFLFMLMFEHAPKRSCSKIAYFVIGFCFITVILLTIVNSWTGCLFTIREGIYTRGALNAAGYAGVGIELVLLIACYFRNKKYISAPLKRLMHMLPVAVAILIFIQMRNRNIMMNGMISAMANLILFIVSQSSRLEQDALTGLGNRTAFIGDLTHRIERAEHFQFIGINLREFMTVNREFGHSGGNEFLYHIARFLQEALREGRVYRIGGVEFAVLLPYLSDSYAEICRETIYDRFQQEWEVPGGTRVIKATICDVFYLGGRTEVAQLVEQMEYAQTLAKPKNETTLLHFGSEIGKQIDRRKYVISCIRDAMEKDRFRVFYQPIYCWGDAVFCSAEALLRLKDRSGKMISPAEFIPLAEEAGLIDQVCWIVLEKVCSFLEAHSQLPFRAVSVNVSMQQLMDFDFVEKVEQCLKRHGIAPGRIRLEITERMISEKAERTREVMQQLTEKGILFYLDDFGMGYSNFASVLSLPIETIKLDLSLVHGAMESEKQRFVLESLVTMFRHAGYSGVAEGIETEEQAELLKAVGADRLQGFYYYQPMSEEEIAALFER